MLSCSAARLLGCIRLDVDDEDDDDMGAFIIGA